MINDDIIYEYPHADRVVIIGDIHGDVKRFKNILIDAKVINNNIEWIAEPQNTIVIQLGDQVDSANRDPSIQDWEVLCDTEMLHFTNFLNNIAKTRGGLLISLIGNHELMNVIGNFSYVSQKSIQNINTRQELFKPTGSLSHILSHRPIVVKIGELLFCHAGLRKDHLEILRKYNKDLSYLNVIWKNFMQSQKVLIEDKEIFDKIILGFEGILWNRDLDSVEETKAMLQSVGCVYMFIGHTTVESVRILHNVVWYVDTGISRAFGTTAYQYVDIGNYEITVKTIKD
jgi:hypothetical protein